MSFADTYSDTYTEGTIKCRNILKKTTIIKKLGLSRGKD